MNTTNKRQGAPAPGGADDAASPWGNTRLPAGVGLDTLAVREGLPPSQWGENAEALFLTSSFVQPDAATSARTSRSIAAFSARSFSARRRALSRACFCFVCWGVVLGFEIF